MTVDEVARDGLAFVWRQHLVPAVGVVEVPAPAGSRWWADVLDPHTVVAWSAAPAGGLDGLALVFGTQWAARVGPILTGKAPAGDASLAPPRLSDRWARVVVVLGTRQWFPLPIDELALCIDEALAWDGAGYTEMAALTIRQVGPVVVQLVAQMFAGQLPPLAWSTVQASRELALAHMDADDPERQELAELETEMQRRTAVDDAVLESAISQWSIPESAAAWLSGAWHPQGALVMGTNGNELIALSGEADPLTVTARILAWGEPNAPEVRAHIEGDAVHVEVELADGVEAYDQEAASILAFTCDQDTGHVLERAPMSNELGASVLLARVLLHGRGQVVVGVYEARLADQLRTDPLGRRLARLDRILLSSWAARRLTHVARAESQQAVANDLDAAERDYRAQGRTAIERAVNEAAPLDNRAHDLVNRIQTRLIQLDALQLDNPVQDPLLTDVLYFAPRDAQEREANA
jgi:hypothetical protein